MASQQVAVEDSGVSDHFDGVMVKAYYEKPFGFTLLLLPDVKSSKPIFHQRAEYNFEGTGREVYNVRSYLHDLDKHKIFLDSWIDKHEDKLHALYDKHERPSEIMRYSTSTASKGVRPGGKGKKSKKGTAHQANVSVKGSEGKSEDESQIERSTQTVTAYDNTVSEARPDSSSTARLTDEANTLPPDPASSEGDTDPSIQPSRFVLKVQAPDDETSGTTESSSIASSRAPKRPASAVSDSSEDEA